MVAHQLLLLRLPCYAGILFNSVLGTERETETESEESSLNGFRMDRKWNSVYRLCNDYYDPIQSLPKQARRMKEIARTESHHPKSKKLATHHSQEAKGPLP